MSGSRAAGMSAVAAIMRAHPDFTTASGIFASMQRDTGDLPGAIATLEDRGPRAASPIRA